MDNDNKILMIIDPQVDFISGSLAVKGAAETMNALAGYIRMYGHRYKHIIVTADRHPIDHCSFERNGGQWPVHCVADSIGAAIWQPIMDALIECGEGVSVLHKGEDPDHEEYSIFKSVDARHRITDIICSLIDTTTDDGEVFQLDICGIAGDYCVADTIRDGIEIYGSDVFRVLTSYVSSIDNGETLSDLIDKFKLSCDR